MSQNQQSPIDLVNPYITDFGKNGLDIQWKKSAHGTIKKDEHGVTVVFGADIRQFVRLDQKTFHLVQFHFHHPSEHWVKGVQQTMELHVVHQNPNDGTRVVIGIFIDASSKAKSVPDLVPHLKTMHLDSGASQLEVKSLNPLDWLPSDISHYYRYEGSLTTPEFDENVSWVILKEPLLFPKAELIKLIKFFEHPARLPQAMNRRYLLSSFKP